ncbi:hypothetical protein F4780DRAFT_776385 [Xylariomycetidae sp. FL0641]|nr:hypothetical protein F4780DRAFT_776385 [Xylariomycetidae sp. FL0641]
MRDGGGGDAIIQRLLSEITKHPEVEIHYGTEVTKIISDEAADPRDVNVRKEDGFLHNPYAPNVILACVGFKETQETSARFIG